MSFDEYRRWLVELVPGWLRGSRGKAFLGAVGALLDDHVQRAVDEVKARYAREAPEEFLRLIGDTRAITRLFGEDAASYRERLLTAFEMWTWAGTERGVLAALRGAGYRDVSIRPAWLDNPEGWAEFDVHLPPPMLTWEELARLVALINEVKPAHTKLRCAVFRLPKLRWNSGARWNAPFSVWGHRSENAVFIRLCRSVWRGDATVSWNAPPLFWNLTGATWR